MAATLAEVNALDHDAFVARLGPLFEESPWVAEETWPARPFPSANALHAALVGTMRAAPEARRIALIRAHPDLAGHAGFAGTLTAESTREQAGAGLDRLTPEEHERFSALNSGYRDKFGFPFVVCVREHTKATILDGAAQRLEHGRGREIAIALGEVAKIARMRLDDLLGDGGQATRPAPRPAAPPAAEPATPGARISYGKLRVPVHRVQLGSDDVLFACEVDVEVLGENFMPAYTDGDNREVVATDTMKNFILRQALEYRGRTLEGFLDFLGRGFLDTYAVMQAVRLTGRELRFDALSGVLFSRSCDDHAVASLGFERGDEGDGVRVVEHESARVGLRLLKVTGSAFTRFARDEYTTLPERVDRPLFVHLDVRWRYGEVEDLLSGEPGRYVAPRDVRDVVTATFDEFVSESIQHLVHEMGQRILARFPPLAEVSFTAENLTRDPVADEGDRRVYTDPFPAQGLITLTLWRDR